MYARVSRATAALATPADLRPDDGARVSPEAPVPDVTGWDEWEAVLCRYLAARAFANWMAYQGRGLRTVIASLYVALDLVRSEAASLMAAQRPPVGSVDASRKPSVKPTCASCTTPTASGWRISLEVVEE